jgi:dTDP-4-dehydrorhamnose reductase
MNILLLGANGQVGWELRQTLSALGSVTTAARSTDCDHVLDVTDSDAVNRLLDAVQADLIVNAAAYTAVDQAESEPELAAAVNADLPKRLGRWAAAHDALVAHYSTDYVFDGSKDGPYGENDTPNPLSVYGRTKLAGDEALIDSGCDHLILRVSWVYGARGKNFLLTMQRLMAERDLLRIVDDQFGAPTWCRRIAEATTTATKAMLESSQAKSDLSGLYHFAPAGVTTWYGFATAIRDASGLDCELEAITTAEYPLPAHRPANSQLDTGKFSRTFGSEPSSWEADLTACLSDAD